MMKMKCDFIDYHGKKQTGYFLDVFQHSHTHGDSALIGGFKAGTVAYPVAVVLGEDGIIYERKLEDVRVMEGTDD